MNIYNKVRWIWFLMCKMKLKSLDGLESNDPHCPEAEYQAFKIVAPISFLCLFQEQKEWNFKYMKDKMINLWTFVFSSELIFFNYFSLESQIFSIGRHPQAPSSPTVKGLAHMGIRSPTLMLFCQLHKRLMKIKSSMFLYLWWEFLKNRVGRKNIKIDLYLQPGIITR